MRPDQIIMGLLATAGVVYLCYEWIPSLVSRFLNYYHGEETACQLWLTKAHLHLNKMTAGLVYLFGPLCVLVVVSLIPLWSVRIIFFVLFSLLLCRLGRKLSKYLYGRFLDRIKAQLMDAMGLIANALRSGMSLLQGMEMAAREMPGSVGQELHQVVRETQLGSSVETALTNFKERIPLKEVATMVDSIMILRETGGNLVETFEILIHTLREEERVQGKIRTLTTQGIAQAVVIILLPFGLGTALYVVSPEYISPLITHWLGWCIVALMLGFQFVGGYAMYKIVKIEV